MILRNKYVFMEEAGNGGGGTGTLLTTSGSGGGAGTTGGTQNSGPAAGAGTQTTGDNGASGNTSQQQNTNWRSALPAELQTEASLQTFNDIAALAKSYVHASKSMGADKIVVPGKLSTDDDWKQVYTKLGLPADIKDYQLKMSETSSMDKDFVEKFKATAHASGILPQQAQKLADWFQEVNSASESEVQKVRDQKVTDDVAALKGEWGAAYDKNLQMAGQVLRDVADPQMVKYLNDTGLGNDTRLVKLLSNIGAKYLKEDQVFGGNTELAGQLDPKSAMKQANDLMANFDSPYHKKDHPNHRSAVQEVQDLMAMAYPQQK